MELPAFLATYWWCWLEIVGVIVQQHTKGHKFPAFILDNIKANQFIKSFHMLQLAKGLANQPSVGHLMCVHYRPE